MLVDNQSLLTYAQIVMPTAWITDPEFSSISPQAVVSAPVKRGAKIFEAWIYAVYMAFPTNGFESVCRFVLALICRAYAREKFEVQPTDPLILINNEVKQAGHDYTFYSTAADGVWRSRLMIPSLGITSDVYSAVTKRHAERVAASAVLPLCRKSIAKSIASKRVNAVVVVAKDATVAVAVNRRAAFNAVPAGVPHVGRDALSRGDAMIVEYVEQRGEVHLADLGNWLRSVGMQYKGRLVVKLRAGPLCTFLRTNAAGTSATFRRNP